MRGARKTRRRQRSRQEIALVNREPDAVSVADIEIGMNRQKRLRLGGRRIAEAVHVMVAVSLGMADADQCAKREVLLHGEASLAGQVLARDEEFLSPHAPLGRARR